MQVGHAVHAANDWATREEAGRWADVNVSMYATPWFHLVVFKSRGEICGRLCRAESICHARLG